MTMYFKVIFWNVAKLNLVICGYVSLLRTLLCYYQEDVAHLYEHTFLCGATYLGA